MAPDISAARAPVGDVATAITDIDSMLKRIHGTSGTRDSEPAIKHLIDTPEQARDMRDGYCTVIYLFITMWRKAAEASGDDLLADVIPGTITRLREMTRNVAPSTIPTMAAMMTAAVMEASPTLWRAQFGDWQREELAAVQATALLLAEGINSAHDHDAAALRMIMETLTRADEEPLGPDGISPSADYHGFLAFACAQEATTPARPRDSVGRGLSDGVQADGPPGEATASLLRREYRGGGGRCLAPELGDAEFLRLARAWCESVLRGKCGTLGARPSDGESAVQGVKLAHDPDHVETSSQRHRLPVGRLPECPPAAPLQLMYPRAASVRRGYVQKIASLGIDPYARAVPRAHRLSGHPRSSAAGFARRARRGLRLSVSFRRRFGWFRRGGWRVVAS
jgi:hypothetical protein